MNQEIDYSEKNYWILVLCFTLCIFGAHQFYLGNKKAGFIRLGWTIILIGLPISLILSIKDMVQLYRGKLYDSKGLPVITPQEHSADIVDAAKANFDTAKAEFSEAKAEFSEAIREIKKD
jgi:TM2 domain-containing membrane protein YozV